MMLIKSCRGGTLNLWPRRIWSLSLWNKLKEGRWAGRKVWACVTHTRVSHEKKWAAKSSEIWKLPHGRGEKNKSSLMKNKWLRGKWMGPPKKRRADCHEAWLGRVSTSTPQAPIAWPELTRGKGFKTLLLLQDQTYGSLSLHSSGSSCAQCSK